MYAKGGYDDIAAGLGADTVWGASGKDTIYGAAGPDVLRGEASMDAIQGAGGSDSLYGNDGNDLLVAWDDGVEDFVYGGPGAADYCQVTANLDYWTSCEYLEFNYAI